jgi:hypothetical protein
MILPFPILPHDSDSPMETVECVILAESDAGVLLRDALEPLREAWFPLDAVMILRHDEATGDAVAEMPLRLLGERGWNE